jgi:hypothetical protein
LLFQAADGKQVAAGLVQEMTAQVDQLTLGVAEVPDHILALMPRQCHVAQIEKVAGQKKKQSHPWEVLPGKIAGALGRAKTRPASFVSTLNPKSDDPWSLPNLVSK